MILFATALAAVNLLSCNSPDLVPEAPFTLEYSIIEGDTIKTREDKNSKKIRETNDLDYSIVLTEQVITSKDVKLHNLNGREPDLSNLKNNKDELLKGKPLEYVAIGGSLTAGFRDGGYFNEGIETSFPSILARQLRIKEFKQPKFDNNDYNGFGRNVPIDLNPSGGPVQKYGRSNNNLGFEPSGDKEIKPKKLNKNFVDYDNLGIPDLNQAALDFGLSGLRQSKLYFDRFDWEEGYSQYGGLGGVAPLVQFKKLRKDLFTIEYVQEAVNEMLGIKSTFDRFGAGPGGREEPLKLLLEDFAKKGMKGAVANIPNAYAFPRNKMIDLETFYTYSKMTKGGGVPYSLEELKQNGALILSTAQNDSLVSENINIALKQNLKWSFFTSREAESITNAYNASLRDIVEKTGYPVVDIKQLYDEILSGRYRTQDGVRVDPGLEGNFFSSDYANPSPFGNAIIANEFIRTLNKFYKLNIPLIPTKEYLTIK